MTKVFVFDHNKCNGCYGCQIGCKDETCYNDWMPYSLPQPTTGQYWLRLEDVIHGQVPKVKLEYKPIIGAQDEAIREYAPEVLQEREDGLIVIDPVKAKGRKDLAEKFEGVYWNEELNVPQGCTGCAHLVDEGAIPHCVELCVLGALQFGDKEDFEDVIANATCVEDVNGNEPTDKTHVYYLNMPHLFIGGEVWDPSVDEEIEGATVTLSGDAEAQTATDAFGDFWFRRIDAGNYHIKIEAEGFKTVEQDVVVEKSLNLGDFALEKE